MGLSDSSELYRLVRDLRTAVDDLRRRQGHLVMQPELSSSSLHQFRIWTRYSGTDYQYAVARQHPDTASVIAGHLYAPSGARQDIAAKAWTTIVSTTDIYLKLSVNEGAIIPTWETSAPSINIAADPAILSLHIGTLTLTGSAWSKLQNWNCPINFIGAIIPAWYGNYSASGTDQLLGHASGTAPAWYLSAGSRDRVLIHRANNGLEAYVTPDDSYHYYLGTVSGVATWTAMYDCDDNQA